MIRSLSLGILLGGSIVAYLPASLSAQQIPVFKAEGFSFDPSDAKRLRDGFFHNEAVLSKFAKQVKAVAAVEDAEEAKRNVDDLMAARKFKEWNQKSAEWLKSNRGVEIVFPEDYTDFEKAEYYTNTIAFFEDYKMSGKGSKLNLKINAYRTYAEYDRFRTRFGNQVAQMYNVNPHSNAMTGPRTFVMKREDAGDSWKIESNMGQTVKFHGQDGKQQIVVEDFFGKNLARATVESSADLDRLKNLKKPTMKRTRSVSAHHVAVEVESDTLSGYENADSIVVITKEDASAYYPNQWVSFSTSTNGSGHSLELKEHETKAFENAAAIYVSHPDQVGLAYWGADTVFRNRYNELQAEKDRIVAAKAKQEQAKKDAESEQERKKRMQEILDSLEENSCEK